MSSYYILLTIVVYFALLLLIARITNKHRENSNSAFFKGNNQSLWYVVAFGMIGASVSGVTFVSVPGMVRSIDFTYIQMCIGFFFGYIIVAKVLLPTYYKLNLVSIYSYLGIRIGSKARATGSFFFLLSRMLGAAARLYLVCLILHTYVFNKWNVPFWVLATGIILFIWLYTHKSGVKTIVWTDTLLTFCLLSALVLIIIYVAKDLNLHSIAQTWQVISHNPHSRIFEFNDWHSTQNFYKQFFSGIFIVIVMTGLDQDMMQKNLSCHNLHDAQKNMYCYGFSFLPINFLFLCLGLLLLILSVQMHISLPANGDEILPSFAVTGLLGKPVLILFVLGIVAAAFSSADSALTSLTTIFCVDVLHMDKLEDNAHSVKLREYTHVGISIVMIMTICLFHLLNNRSIIDAIYTLASYTYGPLLGLFCFGLFTKRTTNDNVVPYIAVSSPIICYLLNAASIYYWKYKFGYEILMLNGMLTFAGLYIISHKSQFIKLKENGN